MGSPLHNFSLRELQNLQDYNNRALAHLEDITIWFWRENSRTFMRRIQIEEEMQFTIPGSRAYHYWQDQLAVAFDMEQRSKEEYKMFQALQAPGSHRRNLAMVLEMLIDQRVRLHTP